MPLPSGSCRLIPIFPGTGGGPLLPSAIGSAPTEERFCGVRTGGSSGSQLPLCPLCQPQLQDWCSYRGGKNRRGGLRDQGSRLMEQFGFRGLCSYPKRTSGCHLPTPCCAISVVTGTVLFCTLVVAAYVASIVMPIKV